MSENRNITKSFTMNRAENDMLQRVMGMMGSDNISDVIRACIKHVASQQKVDHIDGSVLESYVSLINMVKGEVVNQTVKMTSTASPKERLKITVALKSLGSNLQVIKSIREEEYLLKDIVDIVAQAKMNHSAIELKLKEMGLEHKIRMDIADRS